MANANWANREVANVLFTDLATGKPVLWCDFANTTAESMEADRVFAYGGQGHPQRVQFDGDRTGTVEITTQLMPSKLFAMLSGNDVAKSADILKREVLTASASGVTLTSTPAGDVNVFAEADDCGTEVEASVSGKVVSGSAITSGNKYIVYYYVTAANAEVIKFNSKAFPKAMSLTMQSPWKNENDEIVTVEDKFYKVAPQSSFNMSISNTGDPVEFTITLDVMADANGDIYDRVYCYED